MNVAIVMTVKNEARLLKQNIYYHLGIGIKKIYVYFDDSEDDGRNLIESIEGVECLDSIKTNIYDHLPFLKKFADHKLDQHSARQCLNSYDAEQRCLKEGIDWLISIDADELFITSSKSDVSLHNFFKENDLHGYELIRLRVFEVISRKMHYDQVALEETLFKTKKNFKSKFDQISFGIIDPYTKQPIKTHYWYSHTMGKCAIKVGKDLIPHNVHKYVSKNKNVKVKINYAGKILHYFQYDADDFIKKSENFKFRPHKYLSGKPIGGLKRLYIKLVNDPEKTRTEIYEFYEKNLLFDTSKMARLYKTRLFNIIPRKEKALIEITKPREILENYKDLL